jgi:hypothetical protein
VDNLSSCWPTPAGGWQVPPSVTSLCMTGAHMPLRVLADLTCPAGMALYKAQSKDPFYVDVDFWLRNIEDDEVLRAGSKAVLQRALCFLASTQCWSRTRAGTCRCTSGSIAGARTASCPSAARLAWTGCRNHAWLESLDALGCAPGATHREISLSAQDLEILSRLRNIERLGIS